MQFIIHVNTLITNDQNQILVVREKKEAYFDKYNLPGGHLEIGEELIAGAQREVREEVGVQTSVEGLLGVYTGVGKGHYINFIFVGRVVSGEPRANTAEINACEWFSPEEILGFTDESMLNAKKMRHIVAAFQAGRVQGVECLYESFLGGRG